ncbi:hypothetical protein BST61_g6370 [Cercospora zeina]
MDNQMQAQLPQCVVCLDDEIELTDTPGANICVPCLERAFRLAINDPTAYPVEIGGSALEIDAYKNLLPAALVSQYKESERMYKTPLLYRLFCAVRPDDEGCGKFLGDLRLYRNMFPDQQIIQIQCGHCNALTCTCGKAATLPTVQHQCADRTERHLPASERGENWQRCPNNACQATATRIDGCNAMRCGHCQTDFCWLCGQPALHNDPTHWWKVCPRFSTYDNAHATWDALPETLNIREEILVMIHRRTQFYTSNHTLLSQRVWPAIGLRTNTAGEPHSAAPSDAQTVAEFGRRVGELSDLTGEALQRRDAMKRAEADLKMYFGRIMKGNFTDVEAEELLERVHRETGLRWSLRDVRDEMEVRGSRQIEVVDLTGDDDDDD